LEGSFTTPPTQRLEADVHGPRVLR